MNFGSALAFQFRQEDWITKILLASLVSLIPIIGLYFLAGWTLDIAARVIKGDTTLLPALDFSANLKRGFKAFVIAAVHLLPNLIFLTPLLVIALLAQNSSSPNSVSSAMVISSLCLTLLMIVYNLVTTVYAQSIYGSLLGQAYKQANP